MLNHSALPFILGVIVPGLDDFTSFNLLQSNYSWVFLVSINYYINCLLQKLLVSGVVKHGDDRNYIDQLA